MDKDDKQELVEMLKAMKEFDRTLVFIQDKYNSHLDCMMVEDEELSGLKFDLDYFFDKMSDLKDFVTQYIKEEEEYSKSLES